MMVMATMHWNHAAVDPSVERAGGPHDRPLGKGRHGMTISRTGSTIGILGTGRMAKRLAKLFADRGHAVVLGSRTPERAHALAAVLGRSRITGGSYADAAAAEVVLPAMFLRD